MAKNDFFSILVTTLRNCTYDEVVQLLVTEGEKIGLHKSNEPEDIKGYNTLVNDALTASLILKRYDIFAKFTQNFAIDFEHPNSRGNKLSQFVSHMPNELSKQCFLAEISETIEGSHTLQTSNELGHEKGLSDIEFNYYYEALQKTKIPTAQDAINLILDKRGEPSPVITAAMELMLVQGLDINEINNRYDRKTVLSKLAIYGRRDACKLFVEYGADVNNKGFTPLMGAALRGKLDLCKYFIEKGANVNAQDDNNYTALMQAVYYGSTETCAYLIEQRVDINTINAHGSNALILAAGYEGNPETCKLLLDNGADIDISDNDGYTALMKAADCNKIDICQVILDYNPDIHKVNKHNHTALGLSMGKTEVFLKKAIAELKLRTKVGMGSSLQTSKKESNKTDQEETEAKLGLAAAGAVLSENDDAELSGLDAFDLSDTDF